VVRNSSVEERVVVFTLAWPALCVVVVLALLGSGFAFVWAAVEEVVMFVAFVEGLAPVACCRSLPCSVMRAGARVASLVRSCGVNLRRIRSLTGALEVVSEYISVSNWKTEG